MRKVKIALFTFNKREKGFKEECEKGHETRLICEGPWHCVITIIHVIKNVRKRISVELNFIVGLF
jgi:hypothetical protein